MPDTAVSNATNNVSDSAKASQNNRLSAVNNEGGKMPAYKILIVDDSAADRHVYCRYLSKVSDYSCDTTEAEDGETALELLQERPFDLILLDYRLPDMDGLELFRQLQQPSTPPVIMLTGEGSEQIAVEALKMGVQDYLIKGNLKPETLDQTVRRVITQWQLKQNIARQQSRMRLVADIAVRISQSMDVAQTLTTAVTGLRALLDCDRALIYQFGPDMSGDVVAESVLSGWTHSKGQHIEDTCFRDHGAERYLKGHHTVVGDVHNSHLSACHLELLEQFEVKAKLVAPIVLRNLENGQGARLWGLLIAHHCRSTRDWQPDELSLVDDLAVQLSVALQQNVLIKTLKQRARNLSKTNKQLTHTSKLLENRNAELDQFAYVASHDLKAPLRAIKNLADWIQDDLADKLPEENQQQLNLMKSRVQRMEGFIEGLLQYSRAGRQSLEAIPINAHRLIADIVDELSPSQTVTITVPETLPSLQTQKLLLEQVLSNLISNAAKYHHRPDGSIEVVVHDLGTMVRFEIKDDGPGIEPRYHEQIFGVFQTLVSRDVIESTGIGLSIVKKLVEQQDGEITLVSELGQGSTFAFTWPKQSTSASEEQNQPPTVIS